MNLNVLEKANEWKFQARKFWSIVWPINWSNFQKISLVLDSMQNATSRVRGVLIVCTIGLLLSIIFLLQGIYLVLTVETANEGGEINEAIYSQSFSNLNPALPLTNDTERKIVDLIYHPLYRISYPDFLNQNQEPKIEPVLLSKEPEIVESGGEKTVNLELKPDLKWSDETPLTSEDVVYTFNLLKTEEANPDFRDTLENYKITVNSSTNLTISQVNKNRGFNSQLKFLLNFYPISKRYFEDKPLSELVKSNKSLQNSVSSGQFVVPEKIRNEGKESTNPVPDKSRGFGLIVLEKNPQNTIRKVYLQRYILKIYADLIDVPGAQNNSIERASSNKKVDIFSRFLSTGSNISSAYTSEKFGLNQKIIPTNTYYILYANAQSGQWLINPGLRKYVLCTMENFDLDKNTWAVEKISSAKQFSPIQLGTNSDSKCQTSKYDLLSQKNKNGRSTYSADDKGIFLDGKIINLNFLLLQENEEIGKNIQARLKGVGIDSYFTFAKDMGDLDKKISDKTYNIVLLPTTIISQDLYPMYGAKSRNISGISQNNRFGVESENYGEGIEKLIKEYSDSGLANSPTKQRLIEFFRNEYISVNLFRAKKEINFSNRVYLSEASFDETVTFVADLYNQIPAWYADTKRKFRWL
jgi:hypothetical protein